MHELHVRHRHRRSISGLRVDGSVSADDFSELCDEPVPNVVAPVEGEELLELVEDEHEVLQPIATPDLERTEQVPQRRVRRDVEVEPRRACHFDVGVVDVGLGDLSVDRLDRTQCRSG